MKGQKAAPKVPKVVEFDGFDFTGDVVPASSGGFDGFEFGDTRAVS